MATDTRQTGRGRHQKAAPGPSQPLVDSAENPLAPLKAKYTLELASLRELFPEWDEDSLIMALQEAEFEMEAVIERISQGHAGMWHEVKKDHPKEKTSPSAAPASSGPGRTNGELAAGPGRGGIPQRGGFRGGRGGGVAGRGSRGGGRGGRGGFAGGARAKPMPSADVPSDSSADAPPTAHSNGAVWGESPPDTNDAEVVGGWGDEPAAPAPVAPKPAAEAPVKTNGWGDVAGTAASVPAPASNPAPAVAKQQQDRKQPPAKPPAARASPAPVGGAVKPKATSWAAIVKPAEPEPPKPAPQPVQKPSEPPHPKPVSKVIAPPKPSTPAAESVPPSQPPAPAAQPTVGAPAEAKPATAKPASAPAEAPEPKRPPPGLKQPAAAAPAKPTQAAVTAAQAAAARKTLKQDVAVVMPDLAEKLGGFGVGVKFGTVDSAETPVRKQAAPAQPAAPATTAAPAQPAPVPAPAPVPVSTPTRKTAPTPPPAAAPRSRTASPLKSPVLESTALPTPPVQETPKAEPVEVKKAPTPAPVEVPAPVEPAQEVPKPVVEEPPATAPSQPVAAITAPTPLSQLLSTATTAPSAQPANSAAASAAAVSAAPSPPAAAAASRPAAQNQAWGENPAAPQQPQQPQQQQTALPNWQAFQGWPDYTAAIYGGLGQQGVEPTRMGYYDPQTAYNAQAPGFGQTTTASAVGQPASSRDTPKFGGSAAVQGDLPATSAQAGPTSTAAAAAPQQAPTAGTPAAQAGYPGLGMPYAAYYPYGYPMGQFATAPQYGAGAPQGYGRNMYPAMYGPALGQLPQQSSAQGGGASAGTSPAPGHQVLPQQQQVPQRAGAQGPQQHSQHGQQGSQYGYGGFPYGAQEAHTGGLASSGLGGPAGLSEYGKTVYGMGMPGFAGFSANLQDGSVPMGAKQVGPGSLGGVGAQGYGKSYDSHKATGGGYQQLPSGASQASQQQTLSGMGQAYFAGAGQFGPQYQSYGHHQSGGYGGRGGQGYWQS